MTDERLAFRTCPLCEAGCGLEITVKGSTIGRIRGDMDDVFSHGFICPKGSTLKQLHEDPDRLRKPLIKRNGEHVEVEWDEAWAEIAGRLQDVIERHGFDPLMRPLACEVCHLLIVVSNCKPGSAQSHEASAIWRHKSRAWTVRTGVPSVTARYDHSLSSRTACTVSYTHLTLPTKA